MRIISVIAVLLVLAFPAYAEVMVQGSFEGGVYTPFGHTNYRTDGSLVVADPTAPNGSYSLKFTYPAELYGGQAPAIVGKTFASRNEIWGQYYFKYSSNWRWNTITNKQVYVLTGSQGSADMNFTIMMNHYAAISSVATQHPADSSLNQTFRSYGWTVTKDVWHKVVFHASMNTAGVQDGILQMWIDDILRTDQSNVLYRRAGQSTGFTNFQMTPVYGGGAEVIPAEQYLWFDDVIVQTTAFGSGGGDTSAPYPSQWSPAKSSTGVLKTNRTISFHLADDVDVLTANGVVNIEGVDYTCAAGLTCTGGSTDKTITFTKGSDWSNDQVVNITTSGFRDTAGNITATDTWSYTIESASQPAPTIDTTSPLTTRTQGAAFTQTFAVSGGQSPYTWSITAGSLPSGTTLSSAGVFSGVPTTPGPFNFTAKIVDALAAEDTQAYSVIVNPATPGGQTTVNVTTIQDTFIGSTDSTTNFSDNAVLRTYQWPIGTVANRILDNIAISLPDNVSILSARLYMYQEGHEGSGGTSPMRVYAYRTGAQDISTVTWATFDNTLQAYESVTEVATDNAWYSWDVTNMAAWAYANSSPLYVALDGSQDGAANTNRKFTSMEGTEGFTPFLSITYMQLVAPEGPSISAPGKMRVVNFKGTFR